MSQEISFIMPDLEILTKTNMDKVVEDVVARPCIEIRVKVVQTVDGTCETNHTRALSTQISGWNWQYLDLSNKSLQNLSLQIAEMSWTRSN